jgi:hypothetical protein
MARFSKVVEEQSPSPGTAQAGVPAAGISCHEQTYDRLSGQTQLRHPSHAGSSQRARSSTLGSFSIKDLYSPSLPCPGAICSVLPDCSAETRKWAVLKPPLSRKASDSSKLSRRCTLTPAPPRDTLQLTWYVVPPPHCYDISVVECVSYTPRYPRRGQRDSA